MIGAVLVGKVACTAGWLRSVWALLPGLAGQGQSPFGWVCQGLSARSRQDTCESAALRRRRAVSRPRDQSAEDHGWLRAASLVPCPPAPLISNRPAPCQSSCSHRLVILLRPCLPACSPRGSRGGDQGATTPGVNGHHRGVGTGGQQRCAARGVCCHGGTDGGDAGGQGGAAGETGGEGGAPGAVAAGPVLRRGGTPCSLCCVVVMPLAPDCGGF